jgi:hypothetical protein
MKKILTSLTTLLILTLGCSTHSWVSSQDKKPKSRATPAKAASAASPADAKTSPQGQGMMGLRDNLLRSSPKEMGLSGEDAKAKVWGVLMEVQFPEGGVATLVFACDGTASLYTSGGGILGGYIARTEAKRFVVEAEKHLANMKPTKSFPYAEVGRIKFYVLTQDGVYTAEGDEEELVREEHSLSPLFLAGNDVLTVLRTANERAQRDD